MNTTIPAAEYRRLMGVAEPLEAEFQASVLELAGVKVIYHHISFGYFRRTQGYTRDAYLPQYLKLKKRTYCFNDAPKNETSKGASLMTAPTEVTNLPMPQAIARIAGITPDGRLALQIDFVDPNKGARTVVFTLAPEEVFPLSDDLWREAEHAAPAAAQEWAASEVGRMNLANRAPEGSA